jgi:hypothetical protein
MAQRKHRNEGGYLDRSVLPATEQNLPSFGTKVALFSIDRTLCPIRDGTYSSSAGDR